MWGRHFSGGFVSNRREDSYPMIAKKTVIATRDFKDRDGKDRKAGERVQVDEDYGQELVRNGQAKDDPQAEQQPR